MLIGFCSDIGNFRENNEDYFGYDENELYRVYIVADGMGGHNAGEIASSKSVNIMIELLKRKVVSESLLPEDVINILRESVEETNSFIYREATCNEEKTGMGTTLVVAFIYSDNLYVVNVGDSRCYILNEDEFYQLTKDHSFVQELVDIGEITQDEAINHPRRNIITKSIGTCKEVDPDIYILRKNEFDRILLGTDGLFDEASFEEIEEVIDNNVDFEDICKQLVNISKKHKGKDNITVMLIGKE